MLEGVLSLYIPQQVPGVVQLLYTRQLHAYNYYAAHITGVDPEQEVLKGFPVEILVPLQLVPLPKVILLGMLALPPHDSLSL